MKNNKKAKGLLTEFKKFIMRGNVVDMAVGVIIAGAFGAIVTALVNKIFMPLINLIVYSATGGKGIELITILNGEPYFLEDGTTLNTKCIYIDWGNCDADCSYHYSNGNFTHQRI
jgi:large conductance mechanosensitive channel